MKKAKIMLLTLAVFAVLGAALAFKAKTFQTKFCSTTRVLDANLAKTNVCPLFTTSTTAIGVVNRYATSIKLDGLPVTIADDCQQVECPKVRLIVD
jgi:hypothetical protein